MECLCNYLVSSERVREREEGGGREGGGQAAVVPGGSPQQCNSEMCCNCQG